MKARPRIIIIAGALLLVASTGLSVRGAFMVETRPGGKAVVNFRLGGNTTTVGTSTATSGAIGRTANIGSVFGGDGSPSDTYVFRYTPGPDADNTTFAAGTALGSVTGFPGEGNVSSGLTGGVSGIYRVYFTTPESINVANPSCDFTITQDGEPIVLDDVNLNSGGTGPDTDPGGAFVGGANNAWWLLGTVHLTAGTTYTVTQNSNDASFVSQRAHGVMWERVPEPSAGGLVMLALMLGRGRHRGGDLV
jgi:hypothetical protein